MPVRPSGPSQAKPSHDSASFALGVRNLISKRRKAQTNDADAETQQEDDVEREWEFVDVGRRNLHRPELGPSLIVDVQSIWLPSEDGRYPRNNQTRLAQYRCKVLLEAKNNGMKSIHGSDFHSLRFSRDATFTIHGRGKDSECDIALQKTFQINLHDLYGPQLTNNGWKLVPPGEVGLTVHVEFFNAADSNDVYLALDPNGPNVDRLDDSWGCLKTEIAMNRNTGRFKELKQLHWVMHTTSGLTSVLLPHHFSIDLNWRRSRPLPLMDQLYPQPAHETFGARLSAALGVPITPKIRHDRSARFSGLSTSRDIPKYKTPVVTWITKASTKDSVTVGDFNCLVCRKSLRDAEALSQHLQRKHLNHHIFRPASPSNARLRYFHMIIMDMEKPLLVCKDRPSLSKEQGASTLPNGGHADVENIRKRKRDDLPNGASAPDHGEKRRASEMGLGRSFRERSPLLKGGSATRNSTVQSKHSHAINGIRRTSRDEAALHNNVGSPVLSRNELDKGDRQNGERRTVKHANHQTVDDTRSKVHAPDGERSENRRSDPRPTASRASNSAVQSLENLFRPDTSPESRIDPKTGRKVSIVRSAPGRMLPWTSPKDLKRRTVHNGPQQSSVQTSPQRAARVAAEAAIAQTAAQATELTNGVLHLIDPPPTPESKRPTTNRPIVPAEEALSYTRAEARERWAEVLRKPAPRRKHLVPRANGGTTLFRNVSKRELVEGELVSESDDEPDETWLVDKHLAELAVVPGITPAELEFLRLFDAHFMREQLTCLKFVGAALLRFVRENADALLEKHELLVEFCKKAAEMFRIGDVGRRDVALALAYLKGSREDAKWGEKAVARSREEGQSLNGRVTEIND